MRYIITEIAVSRYMLGKHKVEYEYEATAASEFGSESATATAFGLEAAIRHAIEELAE